MKDCERCGSIWLQKGERFCSDCRRAVIKEIRQEHRDDEPMSVRTLSRRNTEMIGRPALSSAIAAELGEDDD